MIPLMIQKNYPNFSELLELSGAGRVVGLDRHGNEVAVLASQTNGVRQQAGGVFPVVIDDHAWSRAEQIRDAQKFRDRIEYIYFPEDDGRHPMLSTWRLDDTSRIEAILDLPFGSKVLEAGCSSGTVAIEIAKLDEVNEVVGIDLRPDAIATANKLIKQLKKTGVLTQDIVKKINFEVSAVEDLDYKSGYFDSVCAFEVLEHLTLSDFHSALENMQRLLATDGTFFVSVPNRYPKEFYLKAGRMRWSAPDHKNYFSKKSLKYLLGIYFKSVTFHSIGSDSVDGGVYLIAEARDKKL